MFKKNRNIGKYLGVAASATVLGWASLGQAPSHLTKSDASMASLKRLTAQILQMTPAWAGGLGGGLTSNLVNGVRGFAGETMGFATHEDYVNLICGGVDPGVGQSCDGPPEVGIVGAITAVVNALPAIATSGGVTSCDAAPASGSITGTSDGASVTVTFATPTHAIPSNWVGGGKTFAHRATFTTTLTDIGPTATTLDVAFEFNCGSSAAAYMAVGMAIGGNAPGYSRDIAIYTGAVDSSTNGFQVFMAEHDRSDLTQIRGSIGIDVHYNPTSGALGFWGAFQTQYDDGGNGLNVMSKLDGSGNYQTGKMLMFNRAISYASPSGNNANPIDLAIENMTGATTDTLESDPGNHDVASNLGASSLEGATNGSPKTAAYEACIDFSSPNSAAAPSDSSCAGFTLTSPPDAPALDEAAGNWSVNWMVDTTGMQAKLEAL